MQVCAIFLLQKNEGVFFMKKIITLICLSTLLGAGLFAQNVQKEENNISLGSVWYSANYFFNTVLVSIFIFIVLYILIAIFKIKLYKIKIKKINEKLSASV